MGMAHRRVDLDVCDKKIIQKCDFISLSLSPWETTGYDRIHFTILIHSSQLGLFKFVHVSVFNWKTVNVPSLSVYFYAGRLQVVIDGWESHPIVLAPCERRKQGDTREFKEKEGREKTLSTGGWRFRKHQLSQEILVYILFVGEVLFFFLLLLLLFLLSVIKGGNLNCYYAIEFVRRLTVKCLPRLGSLRGIPR